MILCNICKMHLCMKNVGNVVESWLDILLLCLVSQATRLSVYANPGFYKANIFLFLTGQLCLRTVKWLSTLGERHHFQTRERLGCSRNSLLWVCTVWQLSRWSLLRWLWHLENLALVTLSKSQFKLGGELSAKLWLISWQSVWIWSVLFVKGLLE